jgi:hypothetical protein
MPQSLLTEEWFAERYNWPADVTRRQPVEVVDWFPVIQGAKTEVQKMHEREERRKHRDR